MTFFENGCPLKTRVPMYITKTKFSYQNRFSVYLCNVKWFLIASKQLRNVPKHLPSHKISFSNLFLSFSNDFFYEIHLKFPQITDFEQEILTERWEWYQISEIHVRFSKISIKTCSLPKSLHVTPSELRERAIWNLSLNSVFLVSHLARIRQKNIKNVKKGI